MRPIIVVPARLESKRLPRKLLLAETGKPLIVETLEMLSFCDLGKYSIVVATDSDEIEAACENHCERVLRTGEAQSGTDRIASVVDRLSGYDLIVNVQADEPDIQPSHIAAVVEAAQQFPACDMATLATPLRDPADRANLDVVKVGINAKNLAIGFGRHADLVWADSPDVPLDHRHIGVYAYTPAFLRWFTKLRQSPNEKRQNLEQLRAIDNDCRIRVASVDHPYHSIDTRAQYDAFVRRSR